MANEFIRKNDKEIKIEKNWKPSVNVHSGCGGLYGLGLIGSAVYYLQHAMTFWVGIIGIIKAVFWPAIVIYKVFDMLKL